MKPLTALAIVAVGSAAGALLAYLLTTQELTVGCRCAVCEGWRELGAQGLFPQAPAQA